MALKQSTTPSFTLILYSLRALAGQHIYDFLCEPEYFTINAPLLSAASTFNLAHAGTRLAYSASLSASFRAQTAGPCPRAIGQDFGRHDRWNLEMIADSTSS